jgi:hypothetical protein
VVKAIKDDALCGDTVGGVKFPPSATVSDKKNLLLFEGQFCAVDILKLLYVLVNLFYFVWGFWKYCLQMDKKMLL